MKKPRKYELKARALSQEETRRRITVAAMQLHEELGPARTSISAIAERAGVQRLTVYRHFPDEASLFKACGGHYRSLHPPPDLAAWRQVKDPELRLFPGLLELYAHYRETEKMWTHVQRDAETSEAVRAAAEPRFRFVRDAAVVLAAGFTAKLQRGAIGHAVQFNTWQSLVRGQRLTDEEAAELMTALAITAATEDRN